MRGDVTPAKERLREAADTRGVGCGRLGSTARTCGIHPPTHRVLPLVLAEGPLGLALQLERAHRLCGGISVGSRQRLGGFEGRGGGGGVVGRRRAGFTGSVVTKGRRRRDMCNLARNLGEGEQISAVEIWRLDGQHGGWGGGGFDAQRCGQQRGSGERRGRGQRRQRRCSPRHRRPERIVCRGVTRGGGARWRSKQCACN